MSEAQVSGSSLVVDIQRLTRTFGEKKALHDVSLQIPRGSVYGLIGSNGAGKTTLIKHLLGSHFAQSGQVRVFGVDPATHPAEVLARIGYMSENREIPSWMRVQEIMNYTQAFFPSWDARYAEELRQMFDLDPKEKVANLSRGQTARTCLLLALAHRPDFLVLDEPSSGLDPVVRRDILAAIVRTITDEGRTVLFSSHLLDEVERLADRIAIVHEGRILLDDALDTIRDSFHRLTLRFEHPHAEAPRMIGAVSQEGRGDEWTYNCRGEREQLIEAAKTLHAQIVQETPLSLDDIYACTIHQA
ncbi:MAG: ABC transporter ATP-binding protein [Pirellulaceae bacterium]